MNSNTALVYIEKEVATPNIQLSPTGAVISEKTSYNELLHAGGQLKKFHDAFESSIHWILGDLLNFAENKFSDMVSQLEHEWGFKYQTLANDKWVTKNIDFSVRTEKIPFRHFERIALFEQDEQKIWIKKILENGKDGKVMSNSDLKLAVREYKREKAMEDSGNLPDDVFQVIYADPPWLYRDQLEEDGDLTSVKGMQTYGATEKHYPSMSINELCEMNMPRTGENAVLFLWVTSPLLEESFEVIRAWGFKYKTSFIWDKVKHNYGHYNSVRHELLLICIKGSCTPDNKKLFDSVQTIEKTKTHSQKPDRFYEIIEAMYGGNKIELFARNKRKGWISWGDEI